MTLRINFSRFLIGRAELVNSCFDGKVIIGRVEHTGIKLLLATSNMARTKGFFPSTDKDGTFQ